MRPPPCGSHLGPPGAGGGAELPLSALAAPEIGLPWESRDVGNGGAGSEGPSATSKWGLSTLVSDLNYPCL